MRPLIIGASGLVGGALRVAFGGAVGTSHRKPSPALEPLDIADRAAVDRLVARIAPDVILLPAAYTAVDDCEIHPERSAHINIAGTRHVADAARAARAKLVFFSTDYLFDGREGLYPPSAPPSPINVYGCHKLEAERIVAATVPDHLIVRACGVYGYQKDGLNFVMSLRRLAEGGKRMRVPHDQWGTPTLADSLAAAVRELVVAGVRGIVHPVGPDYLTRIDFAHLAATVFGYPPTFLDPFCTAEGTQPAARPLRGGVDNRSTQALLRTPLVDVRTGLEIVKRQVEAAAG